MHFKKKLETVSNAPGKDSALMSEPSFMLSPVKINSCVYCGYWYVFTHTHTHKHERWKEVSLLSTTAKQILHKHRSSRGINCWTLETDHKYKQLLASDFGPFCTFSNCSRSGFVTRRKRNGAKWKQLTDWAKLLQSKWHNSGSVPLICFLFIGPPNTKQLQKYKVLVYGRCQKSLNFWPCSQSPHAKICTFLN